MLDEILIYCGSTLIADGNPFGAGVVEELIVNGKALLDVADFLFALGPVFYDRDERTMDVRFTIFSQAATRAAALDAQLRGGIGNIGVNDITIQLTEDGVTYTWTAAASGWGAAATKEYGGFSGGVSYQVASGPYVSNTFADLDGGDDDDGPPAYYTDDWDCQSGRDDDASVVAAFDGGEDVAA